MRFQKKPKPIVKWAGGKQNVCSLLVSHFPGNFDTYYEPFIGGASVCLQLGHSKSVISDENQWLINTYRAVREDRAAVCDILDNLENTKKFFLKVRKVNYVELDFFQQAAYFIYLNKTCFRGLFRVNKKGMFNVPYGDYDRRYYDPENLNVFSEFLKDIEIRFGDFELGIAGITSRDFVYFDPPYYKLGGYSDFNRYTKYQFNESEHFRLAALCHELDKKGVRWALSNSNTPLARHLFEGFEILEISNRREINLKSKNRNIKELLITNYPLCKTLPNSNNKATRKLGYQKANTLSLG